MSNYDFTAIETKWQQWWQEHKTFATLPTSDPDFQHDRNKFYVLDMFPYPSGVGLHVGHPLGYIATDIVARYKRMTGHNVLHPMGFDAFGLPAEQYAVEHGVHPAATTEKNIQNMLRQLKRFGLSYDWDRMIATTDPKYYKWTQWIFLQLYHSWFDPIRQKARPVDELIEQMVNGELFISPDGEIVYQQVEGLEGIEGIPVGAIKWNELDDAQQQAFINDQRLAYIDEVPVNWCPMLGTVLANEEVTNDGRSERGNYPVYRKPLKQWMLRITAYAQRLIDDLQLVDWPEPIKLMQRNWIGRSEGAQVDFTVVGSDELISVFTTRPDTLFGATYMVLAPEHPLVDLVTTDTYRKQVNQYRHDAAHKSERDRQMETKTKTGQFTGGYAINPVNDRKIPIWIADYVLMGYGTGAIMAVPAHDERDFEFANQFQLPIQDVVYDPDLQALSAVLHRLADRNDLWDNAESIIIDFVGLAIGQQRDDYDTIFQRVTRERQENTSDQNNADTEQFSFRGTISNQWQHELRQYLEQGIESLIDHARQGRLVQLHGQAVSEPGTNVFSENDSLSLNDLPTDRAKRRMIDWLEENALGTGKVQYKLRDWLFSRQRYWGEPFPILHGPEGRIKPVCEDQLPVTLPEMDDFKPQATEDPDAPPAPPLARADDSWLTVTDDDGIQWQRELNTMPQWAGSCWYYLRFIDPDNSEQFVDPDEERYWMGPNGIDLYVGGAEHAVLHLLYSRFWHKVLYDLGHLSTPEPFGRLFNQGYIQAYCYRDQRGIAVPADEVVDQDGQPASQVQDKPDRDFFHQGEPVTQEYGKMGKSLKNAANPDDIFEEYGCDTLRVYEMYMGPLEASKPWNTRDIIGAHRFLQRIWRNFVDVETGQLKITPDQPTDALRRLLHKTIKRVTDDMDRMAFNTAIAALIELNNAMVKLDKLPRTIAEPFVLLLAPIAPHIAEELWQRLGHDQSLACAPWPQYDDQMLLEDTVEIAVQIRGKMRGRINVPADADEQTVLDAIHANEKLAGYLEGKKILKAIVIPGKLVNLVTN